MINNYNREKIMMEKNLVFVAMIICLISLIYDFLDISGSPMLFVIDSTLLLLLVILQLKYESIIKSEIKRRIVFLVYPLIYYPIAIISSDFDVHSAVMYFFLFNAIIVYFNSDFEAIAASLVLMFELLILVFLIKNGYMASNHLSDILHFNSYHEVNFLIVGLGTTIINLSILKKNSRLSNILLHNSTRDYLTGAYNRRYLEDVLDSSVIDRDQFKDSYVIFLDIDNFKKINDGYGHDLGDEVLRQFTYVVMSEIRGHDIFSRYGGDEFVLIVREISFSDVTKLIERIKQEFEIKCHELCGFTVNFSLGIEKFDVVNKQEIISQADFKMYLNKSTKAKDNEDSLETIF